MFPPMTALPPPEGGFILSQFLSHSDPLLTLAHFSVRDVDEERISHLGIALPVHLQRAVKKRRVEYLVSRYVTRELFARCGVEGFTLTNYPDRSPCWPTGFRGSLSHTDGTVVVALTRQQQCIGVDAERVMSEKVAQETAEMLMNDAEKACLLALPIPFATAATLLFSLKESLYKALWPELHQPMDFHQAEVISVDLSAQRATLRLCQRFDDTFTAQTLLNATFRLEDDLVITLLTHAR